MRCSYSYILANANTGTNGLIKWRVQYVDITYERPHSVVGVSTWLYTHASQTPKVETILYFVTYSTGNTGEVRFMHHLYLEKDV